MWNQRRNNSSSSSANNKYMGDKFHPEKDSSLLQYLDANNLYGWAMSRKLPTGEFYWVDLSQFTHDNINIFANCKIEGYLLEVDVRYPKELQITITIFHLCVKR